MKRVCLISTVNHNVGDDFVRAGILSLLREVLGEIEVRTMHKHFPATVRGEFWNRLDAWTRGLPDRLSWRTRLSRLVDVLPMNPQTDLALGSDLIVQSGAPVYWKNAHSKCAHNEWFGPVVKKRWKLRQGRVPLLNLGAGSCQAWGSDGTEVVVDLECRAFIDEFTGWCAVTTVRDALAQRMVSQCGHAVPLLPCPSIFAPGAMNVQPRDDGFVALNYMPDGGHYDLAGHGAGLRQRWEEVFCEEARQLARRIPCQLICHDRKEDELAARLLPEVPRFFSRHWRDYLDVYSRCRFAVVNRVHGAVVAAAMGKRVLLTGNDTRLLTAAEVPGIKILTVSQAVDALKEDLEEMAASESGAVPVSFLETTRSSYLRLLSSALLP